MSTGKTKPRKNTHSIYHLGPIGAEKFRLNQIVKKVVATRTRLSAYVVSDKSILEDIDFALASLSLALSKLDKVPKTWTPKKGTNSMSNSALLVPNQSVRLQEKYKNDWTGLLDHTQPYRVIEVVGTHVTIEVNRGGKRDTLLIARRFFEAA